jgi:hypothetical protein
MSGDIIITPTEACMPRHLLVVIVNEMPRYTYKPVFPYFLRPSLSLVAWTGGMIDWEKIT